nr:MAG TPA: hypothetical protein [Caudoviricetes sp.]
MIFYLYSQLRKKQVKSIKSIQVKNCIKIYSYKTKYKAHRRTFLSSM